MRYGKAMSITKQIAKNTAYLALGKALSTILGVLTIALLLRYLSPDDYGRYTTVLAFILLFGTFADFGLNLTTTQDISLPNTNIERTLSSIFTLRVLINIALVLLLPIILLAFPYETDVKNAILISSVLFFTYSLFQVLASYFQKTLQAGKVAFAELIGRIILLLTTLLAIYFHFSFLEIMLTIVASSLAQLWVLLRFTSREIHLGLVIDMQVWKRIITKTWPIALSVIFTTIYFKGDAVILSLTRPYQDVGIYGAAYKILEVLITLPILFMGLVLPHLSSSFAQSDSKRFNNIIQKTWDALCLIAIPIVLGTLILGQQIMDLITGGGYADSVDVLRILIVAAGIIFLGSLFTHAIVAVNQQKSMIKYYALAAVLAVALYIIYIPTYSYYAAAVVTVLSEALIAIAAFMKVKQTARLSLSMNVFFKAIIFSIIMGTILYLLQSLHILILIPSGAAIYAGLILITKTYRNDTKKFMKIIGKTEDQWVQELINNIPKNNKKIIILVSFFWQIFGTLFAKIFGFKTIWIANNAADRALARSLIKIMSIFVDTVIAPNQSAEAAHLRIGVKSQKIQVIYPICHDGADGKLSKDNVIIGCDGEIMIDQGLGILMQAIASAKEIMPNIKLVIGGQIADAKRIIWISKQLKLENNVQILPTGSKTWMLSSHIYVMPGIESNAFPFSFAQAMMLSKAIIATDSLKAREFVEPNKGAILIKQNNVDMLTQAIINLARNPEWMEELGSNNREFAIQKFSQEAFNQKIHQIIN